MPDKNIQMARRVAEAVAEAGGRTFYVGGIVRDWLMGRACEDEGRQRVADGPRRGGQYVVERRDDHAQRDDAQVSHGVRCAGRNTATPTANIRRAKAL